MKPDEEDALIARYFPEVWASGDPVEIGNARGLIRAAVAHERERAAKVCESLCADYYPHAKGPYIDCAAAIRRGE